MEHPVVGKYNLYDFYEHSVITLLLDLLRTTNE